MSRIGDAGGAIIEWLFDNVFPWVLLALLAALVLGGIAIGIGACSDARMIAHEGHVSHGIIVEKHHRPPTTTYVLVGKIMAPIYTSETWEITIYGPHDKSGRQGTENYGIDPETYQHLHKGDTYP